MSQPNLIKLGAAGDVLEISAFGRTYTETWEDGLTREDRAASGKLRRDIITRKGNFTLAYELADQELVDRIELLWLHNGALTLEVTHLTVTKTYTVLMQPFSKSRLLAVWGGLWEGVTLELREV